jgi:N-carbamoylputrescine amidase
VLIRDLDLDMVRQMRDDWQFYRDRRPDSYTKISAP